jgi:carbonic anhydrase
VKVVEVTYRYDGTDAAARPPPVDAEGARQRLDEGSRAIATLLAGVAEDSGTARRVITVDPRDLGIAAGDRKAPKQTPYAAVLGCSDARVPIELIFNEGPNDLFVVRVAGNGLGTEVLGSLNYAADHLRGSLKLIVVLGHSGCGAVASAVDVFLNPRAYLGLTANHSLRTILDRLLVVVHAAVKRLAAEYGPEVSQRRGYRDALIEAAVVSNAALVAFTLQQELAGMGNAELRAAYGVYLLAEHRVWVPSEDGTADNGLAYPPTDTASFARLADAIVRSRRIAALLDHGAD